MNSACIIEAHIKRSVTQRKCLSFSIANVIDKWAGATCQMQKWETDGARNETPAPCKRPYALKDESLLTF